MRSFYLRVRIYAINKNTPKFIICIILSTFPAYTCFSMKRVHLKHRFLIKVKNLSKNNKINNHEIHEKS